MAIPECRSHEKASGTLCSWRSDWLCFGLREVLVALVMTAS